MRRLIALAIALPVLANCRGRPIGGGVSSFPVALERAYKGDLAGAVDDLKKVVERDPANAPAFYFRGFLLRDLKRLPEAVGDLSRAIELSPALGGAYYQRALALKELGQLPAALDDIEKAVRFRPAVPELLYLRAQLLWGLDHGARAEETLDEAIKLRPSFHTALILRSRMRRARQAPSQAIADCEAAIKSDERVASGYACRAAARQAADDRALLPQALADITRAIELMPGNPQYHSDRADIHSSMYQNREAARDLTSALEGTPRAASLWVDRAVVYRVIGFDEKDDSFQRLALDDLGKALALAPKMRRTLGIRENVRHLLGDAAGSIEDCRAILQMNGRDASAHVGLCNNYRFLKRYDDALRHCATAIDLQPRSSEAYRFRCGVYRAQGRNKDALADCNRAVEYNPDQDNGYMDRARVLALLKRYDEALKDVERAIFLNPAVKQRDAAVIANIRFLAGKGSKP